MPGHPNPAAPMRDPADLAGVGRTLPRERGVVPSDPGGGGGAATPSFAVPPDSSPGLPGRPAPLAIGPRTFACGSRSLVMGVLSATPDSFSGGGLIAAGGSPVRGAVALA